MVEPQKFSVQHYVHNVQPKIYWGNLFDVSKGIIPILSGKPTSTHITPFLITPAYPFALPVDPQISIHSMVCLTTISTPCSINFVWGTFPTFAFR